MKVMLDTCAIIWAISDPEQLTRSARQALLKKSTEVFVSPISCAEVACLVERKRIILDRHWKIWFRHFVDLNGWQVIPIDLPVIEESYSLPQEFHRDPADRIIVASARLFHCEVITADHKIIDYPHVKTLW